MTKAGEQIIAAASSGISKAYFINPFTMKAEEFTTRDRAVDAMFSAALARIEALELEVRDIKDRAKYGLL